MRGGVLVLSSAVVQGLLAIPGTARPTDGPRAPAIGQHSDIVPPEFYHVREGIDLDGELSEGSWNLATRITDFFEISPANVGIAKSRTTAMLMFDERFVYVGVRSDDEAPREIRSHSVRRDRIDSDQDFVELIVAPFSNGTSAAIFRTNPLGLQTDGQFSEVTQAKDLTIDLDFDVSASVDETGWTAEFRIPFESLRYNLGSGQEWAVIVTRNIPRVHSTMVSSAPLPRATNCTLCLALEINAPAPEPSSLPISVTPHVVYTHNDLSDTLRVGLDSQWRIRSNTAIDVTVAPDFSQVEADDLQLTANTRFALTLQEKRPFFLEGADLLTSQIAAIYTRAFTDPSVGARITNRDDDMEYTAVLLRDTGGGFVLEPNPIASRAGPQDFSSVAAVGRYRATADALTYGALVSLRQGYADGHNTVVGVDADWNPTRSDKISMQVLWSKTRNPERPDLLDVWDGRQLSGGATAFTWLHSTASWYTNVAIRNYSHDFRSWNGLVSQVGVLTRTINVGVNAYPRHWSWMTRLSPNLSLSQIGETGGSRLTRTVAPGIAIECARDTIVSLMWTPDALNTTLRGIRSYNSWSASIVSTPTRWTPRVTLAYTGGEVLNFGTGDVGDGARWNASLPLVPFKRLEVNALIGSQTITTKTPTRTRLLTEKNTQVSAVWHASRRAYVQALIQRVSLRQAANAQRPLGTLRVARHSTLLFGYQSHVQTRYIFGLQNDSEQGSGLEVFAKLMYAVGQ